VIQPATEPDRRRSWPRRLLNRLEVDQAVFYAILSRVWQFVAGPVSMLVIARSFSPELQGYFYTFASLMGLQTLVELGLHGVIVTVASHEWAGLSLAADGGVAGKAANRRRLASLTWRAFRWYGVLAGLFVLGVSAGGYWFLSTRVAPGVEWEQPWLVLVALNGLVIWGWSLTAILEGCNQVVRVSQVRCLQAITGSLAVWPAMLLGWGLWSAVVAVAVRVVWDAGLIVGLYRRFFASLREVDVNPESADSSSEMAPHAIDWSDEVWPLQWRMAVRSVAQFFAGNLFVPILFFYHGSVAAGQLGMTWTALAAIESAAFAWVQMRVPLLGMLASDRNWRELDRVWFRLTRISLAAFLAAAAGLLAVLWTLPRIPHPWGPKLADRLSPLEPTALFLGALFLLSAARCLGAYILAHKRDPLLWPGLISCGVGALAVWWGGRTAGATGMGIGYLAAISLVLLPWWVILWRRTRRDWHG
jgi:hypothetical protein